MVMAKKRTQSAPSEPAVFVPPYPPSWVDRLTRWVDRLPGPAWAYYSIAGLALVVSSGIVQWREGAYASSGYPLAHIFLSGQPALVLALIHYLDRYASRSFDRIRPTLRVTGNDEREVYWRLTTLPARATWLASLVGLLLVPVTVLTPNWAPLWRLAPTPVSFANFAALAVLIWAVNVPFFYHTVHQLAWVRAIHARYTAVDLYNLQPLYAFSGLTVRTALVLLAFDYGWVFIAPSVILANAVNVGASALFAVLAVVAFAWPLWGIHRLLIEEKAGLLTDCFRRMKAAAGQLRRRVDSGQIRGMDDLHKTMASLEIEHSTLTRIPTWPWESGTLRGLLAAVGLPVVVWLVQVILGRYLR